MAEIVVGIDGSGRGNAALAFARRLAGDRVTVAMPTDAVGLRATLLVFGQQDAARVGLEAGSHAGGDPSRGAAVAIVPDGYEADRRSEFTRLGCGVDGGQSADAALRIATRTAEAMDAELEVIRVVSPSSRVIDDAVAEQLVAAALGELNSAVAALPPTVGAHAVLVQDEPARGLASRSHELDLLLVGSRSDAPAGDALLGRVSARLVWETKCPVVVVPRDAEEALFGS